MHLQNATICTLKNVENVKYMFLKGYKHSMLRCLDSAHIKCSKLTKLELSNNEDETIENNENIACLVLSHLH